MSVVGGPCPSPWSHVCAEQVFRLCGAHIPQRLSLSPGCSPAPTLSVMSRAGHCSEGGKDLLR